MVGTFADSWKLTKTSFRLIREDRALLVFPLVAGLSLLGLVALLLLGEYWLVLPGVRSQGLTGAEYGLAALLAIATYFGMAVVSVYCTAALVGAATLKLNGQQPTAADGWKVARSRLGRLIAWALLSATIGLLIQLVASRLKGLGGLVVGLVGGVTWSIVTYFMIPVLLYEDQKPWPALKRSAHLFTSTLGRSLVSNLVLGLLLGVGIVVAVIVAILGFVVVAGGALLLGLTLVGIALAVGVIVALIGSAAEGILRAALYRYATTGKIEPTLLPSAYQLSANAPPLGPLA